MRVVGPNGLRQPLASGRGIIEEQADRDLAAAAADIKASGVLGRSRPLQRLFDFLVAETLAGRSPKEVEVAQHVFDRPADIDLSQDATVRVSVHRLRKKLEARQLMRATPGPALFIPKGEYRLRLLPYHAPAADVSEEVYAAPRRPALWAAIALLMVGAIVAIAILVQRGIEAAPPADKSPLWAPLAANGRPVLVVVGDYFIFGEKGAGGGVARLIRDRAINSRDDLDAYLMSHREEQARFVDLDLHYLPNGIAPALATLLRSIDGSLGGARQAHVLPASQLTPDLIKTSNLVYLGYLSGLGLLHKPVFDASMLSPQSTDEVLVDAHDGHRYVADRFVAARQNRPRRDYGYVAAFGLPGGSRAVVVAATRNPALAETAEKVADREQWQHLLDRLGHPPQFEVLYEIGSMGAVNLAGRQVLARPIRGLMPGSQAPVARTTSPNR